MRNLFVGDIHYSAFKTDIVPIRSILGDDENSFVVPVWDPPSHDVQDVTVVGPNYRREIKGVFIDELYFWLGKDAESE